MYILESILVWLIIVLVPLLVFGVPISVIAGFIVSIVKYKHCSTDEAEKRRKYKKAITVFGIIFGAMVIAIAVLIYYIATTPIMFM